MQKLAAALEVNVEDIDEFRKAKRQRAYEAAAKQGLPDEHQADIEAQEERFQVEFPDEKFIRMGALRSFQQLAEFLFRSGPDEDVDRVYRAARDASRRHRRKE